MPDYSKGKIYTIRYRGDNNLVYVGSTTQNLSARMGAHRRKCRNANDIEYNKYLYQKMREVNNIDNWYIELYQASPCENKEQLCREEGKVIREIGILNQQIAGRTRTEYEESPVRIKEKLN
jgi:hypothetical protein